MEQTESKAMASARPRSVFTGIGLLTPLGLGAEAFWQALRAGQSGVRPIRAFDASELPIRIAGEVRDFDAKAYVDKKDRKSLKVMARAIQMGVAGSSLALQHAGIDPNKLDPTRFGIDFGAGLIASELDELAPAATVSTNGTPGRVDMAKWGQLGLRQMPPLWMLKYLPNMSACHVSIMYNAQGPNNTITENDVAPLLAINEAHRIISRGQADVMLCGGADSKVNPLSLARLSLFSPFSQRSDAPEKASRPFERHRDGLVPGEGAGILVLEELEHAKKRGATIYGEVVGTGAAFDLKRNGDGLARAISAALQEAGVEPDAVDHINAQGFSTRREDMWEARGLHKVFGKCSPAIPVFAGKSYFGSLGSGGAGVELAASLFAFRDGVLPPTLNFEEADPECPVSVLSGQPRNVERDCFLKVSFTEIGQCAALVIRRWHA
jgi:3-oxoacyl-[acyl-carrier-protein] synthase II